MVCNRGPPCQNGRNGIANQRNQIEFDYLLTFLTKLDKIKPISVISSDLVDTKKGGSDI